MYNKLMSNNDIIKVAKPPPNSPESKNIDNINQLQQQQIRYSATDNVSPTGLKDMGISQVGTNTSMITGGGGKSGGGKKKGYVCSYKNIRQQINGSSYNDVVKKFYEVLNDKVPKNRYTFNVENANKRVKKFEITIIPIKHPKYKNRIMIKSL